MNTYSVIFVFESNTLHRMDYRLYLDIEFIVVKLPKTFPSLFIVRVYYDPNIFNQIGKISHQKALDSFDDLITCIK